MTVSISPSENELLVGFSPFAGCELDSVFVERSITETEFYNYIFSGVEIKSIEFGGKLTEVQVNICSRHAELERAFISEGIEKINYGAFRGCTSLSHISFPNSLTMIDAEAFFECKSLKEVNLPESTLSIGTRAFAGCASLEKVSFPLNLTAIRSRAFMECSLLKEAALPNHISVIEDNAFEKCAIETVVIPSSLKELGTDVFKNCASLKTLTIEASDEVLKVGYSPFWGCKLDKVFLDRELGDLQVLSFEKIFNDAGIKSIVFGENLSEIPFIVRGHVELEHVLIHEGAKKIEGYAFYGCTSLSNVSLPNSLLVIGSTAFRGCTSLKNITLNSGLKELVGDTFIKSGLEAIEIPASVEKIGCSFVNCKSLKNVIINESDSALVVNNDNFGNCPFTNCEIDSLYVGRSISNFLNGGAKIKSIAIGGKMKEVPTVFCRDHKELERLNIMEGVEIIGSEAFSGCSSLSSISFPSSLIRLKYYAFNKCSALEELNLPANLTYIEPSVFSECSSLRNIYFQDGLTTIGWDAFKGCTSLEELDLPNNLKTIDRAAFMGTTSLKKIHFPASLRELSSNVFSECGIETLEIPASIESINQSYTDCASLKTVVICDNDSELYAEHPFMNCSLDSLYIGRNLGEEIYKGMTVKA